MSAHGIDDGLDQRRQSVLVYAVVVTRNRVALLARCIEALQKQNYKLSGIIVVDNGSTDETQSYLNSVSDVTVHKSEINLGSAGGQAAGITRAAALGAEFIWCMDDDTAPDPSALAALVKAANICSEGVFFAPMIYDLEGQLESTPAVSVATRLGWSQWNRKLPLPYIALSTAVFVGVLFRTSAIQKCGLPIKEMFLWGDDLEYTRRLTRISDGWLVGDARVTHLRKGAEAPRLLTECNRSRLHYHRYHTRNTVYLARANRRLFVQLARNLQALLSILFAKQCTSRAGKLWLLIAGTIEGMAFNPRVDFLPANGMYSQPPTSGRLTT